MTVVNPDRPRCATFLDDKVISVTLKKTEMCVEILPLPFQLIHLPIFLWLSPNIGTSLVW